jgi:hypothetical protein
MFCEYVCPRRGDDGRQRTHAGARVSAWHNRGVIADMNIAEDLRAHHNDCDCSAVRSAIEVNA